MKRTTIHAFHIHPVRGGDHGRGRRGPGRRGRGFGPGSGPDFGPDFGADFGEDGPGRPGGPGHPGGPGDPTDGPQGPHGHHSMHEHHGPHGPRGPWGGRGPRRGRRGDVRKAILSLLAEQPMNGYQVIAAVAERSDGIWRPGPGSVYPALGLLQDEGLIAPDESDSSRRKVYALTDEGRTHVADHGDELAAVWDQATRPHRDYRDMRLEFGQLGAAIQQVLATGDERQFAAAQKVLAEARRAIYRILAADEPASE